jgi:hypothetical protein
MFSPTLIVYLPGWLNTGSRVESRPYTGAKIAQLSREVFAIAGDGAFTEVALKIYVSRFPPAQRSRMATRAVVRKVTGASPLTTSRP